MTGVVPGRPDEVKPAGPRRAFRGPVVPDPADTGGDDLAVSLAALSLLSSAQLSLTDLLTRVATIAVQAIPSADGAGLTLIEQARADIIVKSAPFVREVDDIQYRLGEGPCISAAAAGQTMRSGSLGGDPRWVRFGGRAGRLGVHSALSLPLISDNAVVGTLNVYAHAKHAFDERSVQVGESFAVPAAIAVQNAQILDQTRRLAANLQAALTSRAVIDQAIGITLSRHGVTADEAFSRLRTLSQREHVKVTVIAAGIVQAAVHRARGFRSRGSPPLLNGARDGAIEPRLSILVDGVLTQ